MMQCPFSNINDAIYIRIHPGIFLSRWNGRFIAPIASVGLDNNNSSNNTINTIINTPVYDCFLMMWCPFSRVQDAIPIRINQGSFLSRWIGRSIRPTASVHLVWVMLLLQQHSMLFWVYHN